MKTIKITQNFLGWTVRILEKCNTGMGLDERLLVIKTGISSHKKAVNFARKQYAKFS